MGGQVGLGGILLTLTGSPVFTTTTVTQNFILPDTQIENQQYGVYEGIVGLIRTFRPTGADGFNLFLNGAGNNTLSPIGAGDSSYNIGIGRLSLINLTVGFANVGIGYESLNNITTGHNNIAIGYSALNLATTAVQNVAIGGGALVENIDAIENIAIGFQASRYVGSAGGGRANVFIGYMAGFYVTSGEYNVAIGKDALYGDSHPATGSRNVAIGRASLLSCKAGDANVALGDYSGGYWTGSNALFVDDRPRGSEANDIALALIYGTFANASANQRLRINGRLGITHLPNYINNAAAVIGGLASGELYTVTGTDPLQVAAVV